MKVPNLWENNSWWVKISKNWLKKKAKLAPWMEQGAWNLLAQIWTPGVLWIPSTTNVFPLLGGDNQGGYGVVHKVQIKRFDHIPNTIELEGEITPKMDDKQKECKQQSVKVLACSCKHLGVIKFLAIHIEIMEAYTLCWNGGTFQDLLIKTWNTPPLWPIIPYCGKGGHIWKGEHDLSPSDEIMWNWHGHS